MHTTTDLRQHLRPLLLLLLPMLAASLLLGFAAPASARTTVQIPVSSIQTRPDGVCENGAFICGTADLAGYGSVSWDMFVTGFTPDYSACGSGYTATTYFTLSSDPASTLVVDEAGDLCGLGHDGASYRSYFVQGSQAFGHPFAIVGTWTVSEASTGRFEHATGSGTSRITLAGASVGGSYVGVLGS